MKGLLTLFAGLVITAVISFSVAHAAIPWPEECQTDLLPGNDQQYPEGQLVLTCVPDNWNGQLVVYAHGYVPVQMPLALPADELTMPDGQTIPEILLSSGFAFATSSYHKNGYAVEQAGEDLNDLVEYFKAFVAPSPVQHVFITGASEGGLIATMLLERYPQIYYGGLALCGPVGGAPYQIKYLGDFRVVFDYFFPEVFPFGMADVPEYAYLDWQDFYVPAIISAIESDPAATEQLFNVTRAAIDPRDPDSYVTTALSVLFYSIWGTNDMIDVAGGQPYGNSFTWYRGSANDFALNAAVERVTADPAARTYLNLFYQTTGKLQRQLVTLHTTQDGLVPFRHELKYLTLALFAGRIRYLTVLPVPRYGHCNFTTQEVLGAFALMVLRSTGQLDPGLKAYLLSQQDFFR